MSAAKTARAAPAQHSARVAPLPKPAVARGARRAILHICADLEPAEPARETVDLSILTHRSGRKALIASSGGLLVTEAERAAVRHTRMPLHSRGMFVNWRNRVHLTSLIQRERPSLIHAHGLDMLPMAMSLSRAHRLPFIADLTEPLPDHPRVHRLMAELNSMPCFVRVPSEYMHIRLQETFHLTADLIGLVPPGIDMLWHSMGAIGAERLQGMSRLWRVPEQANIALIPMPLNPGSGHEVFLEALATLKNENIFAVMIGSDRHSPGRRAALESEITRLDLHGKVVMPEYCTDWPTAFWLAGVVIAPNIAPHGQNRALLAAQAVGRPVIVTDSGANTEMVRSGETAWIVPSGDAKALAAALRQTMVLRTDQRIGLAVSTREFIANYFPHEAWFGGMIELYESLLRSPSSRELRQEAA